MTSKDISKETLDKIKKEAVKPTPRWQFLLKKSTLWAVYGLSLLVGAVAVSVIILMLTTNDWAIRSQLRLTQLGFFFRTLPYFWIGVFIILMLVAYYNFKHVPKGYKYRFTVVVLSNILASILLGFALFGIGAARHVDTFALRHMPLYERLHELPRMQRWMNPESGLLGGRVVDIQKKENMLLIDFDGTQWQVDITAVPPEMLRPVKKDQIIGVIGEKTEDNEFKAKHIKPWLGNMQNMPGENFPPPMRMMGEGRPPA